MALTQRAIRSLVHPRSHASASAMQADRTDALYPDARVYVVAFLGSSFDASAKYHMLESPREKMLKRAASNGRMD